MASLEILTGRNYLSYSSLSSWLDCGERFRLERVLDAPQENAWWFIGGDAVHKATEDCDIDGITSVADAHRYFNVVWQNSLSKLYDEGVDLNAIKAGGRKSAQWPNKEDRLWWEANGAGMVANWVVWREQMFAQGWQFLSMGEDRLAIEVPIEVQFDDVLVKGYIDRVLVSPFGEAVVVDLKSGSRVPASTLQLGIYALGMTDNYEVTPSLGGYYMTRQSNLTDLSSLLHYTRERVGAWFAAAKRGIEAEVFIPHVGPFCGTCSVAKYCTAVGGDDRPLAKSE